MGLRIAFDPDDPVAVLWDSVSGVAFGPVFESAPGTTTARDDAQAFVDWLPEDARKYTTEELEILKAEWEEAKRWEA